MYHDSWINQYDEQFDTKKSNDSPVDIDACELLDPLPFPPEEPWPPWPDPKDPPDPAVVPDEGAFVGVTGSDEVPPLSDLVL